ncbi:zinc-binding dehydrogenase [Streptomyces bobili]|uniref:zinc-binding dehydrogenase n=1 Tax=Streptomyces bobili TaxID=67280 RepID=UPI0033B8E72E
MPEPTVGDRDVLVRASASSINPLDKMVRNGEFKQLLTYKLPFTIGHDVAGVVTRLGSAVHGFCVRYEFFFMEANGSQLRELGALYDSGKLRPVIDSTFPFDRTLEAMAHVEHGRTKAGKVVVSMMPGIG